MPDKKKLNALLDDKPPVKGKPLGLSTDEPASPALAPESATSHHRTIAPTNQQNEPERKKRGYALREDLIDRCKHLAITRKKTLYEVMEAALEMYLAQEEDQGKSDR
jgi:hypothetical protein